ncbi:MAG: inositol monophosphatase [Pseudomonadota bacterium]
MSDQFEDRLEFAKKVAMQAGNRATDFFNSLGNLVIESKGAQDFVSNADRDVETLIRSEIAKTFPDDGIIGEEFEDVIGTSDFTWVIDPIDGTTNFVSGIPQWCVIIACIYKDMTKIGVIYEPGADELFSAMQGNGAFLNNKPIAVSTTTSLDHGTLGVGMNGRTETISVIKFLEELTNRGGIFFRNASGGLMLCYVAAGRLIGYAEPHMNAWDCLAGQLIIAEAGGCIESQSVKDMLQAGGRVIASAPPIFEEIVAIADRAFD